MKLTSENVFEALYFTLPSMDSIFNTWPEFCLIDTTYNLLELDYPVGLMNVVDGNGSTEIVAVCIVANEAEENMSWFLETFKKLHPEACKKIKSFMGDKDITVRTTVMSLFGVPMYICTFHTGQIFKREISTDKLSINKQQRDTILNILQKIIYALNETEYISLYNELCSIAPKDVISYFDKNWHNCREFWVKGMMFASNFMNDTNNRTESLNSKIKLFCKKSNFFPDFVRDFIKFLIHVHQNERNTKAVESLSKVPAYEMSTDLTSYCEVLTKFAFQFVEKQFEFVKFVTRFDLIDSQILHTKSITGAVKYHVTTLSCTCKIFLSMGLPCRHILKLRQLLSLSSFDKNLIFERWTKDYFLNHRIFQTVSDSAVKLPVNSLPVSPLPSTSNSDYNDSSDTLPADNVLLIKPTNKRGRPKGKKLNFIGLPKKMKIASTSNSSKFNDKTDFEKSKIIFSWFLPLTRVSKFSISDKLTFIDVNLQDIPCLFYNDEVNLNVLKSFMDADAFKHLNDLVIENRENVNWVCYHCLNDLATSQRKDKKASTAIMCDSCLKWFHFECVKKVVLVDDVGEFFCSKCK